MKKALKPNKRKVKFSISISPECWKLIKNLDNKSQYIQTLIEANNND